MVLLSAADADSVDSEQEFFFRPLGGVAFTKPSHPLDAPGPCALVAASSAFGLVVFSDLSGMCTACMCVHSCTVTKRV
jgi:hypothetical protein